MIKNIKRCQEAQTIKKKKGIIQLEWSLLAPNNSRSKQISKTEER